MVKIVGPLQSEQAHGTIVDFLTFSKRSTGQQARWQKKQLDAKAPGQLDQRGKFLNASLACRLMDYGSASYGAAIYGAEEINFNDDAKPYNLTGYNLCIKEFLSL